MKHTYKVTGMTCNGCKASVTNVLAKVEGVTAVHVNLEESMAEITMEKHIPLESFSEALPSKYAISEKNGEVAKSDKGSLDSSRSSAAPEKKKDDIKSDDRDQRSTPTATYSSENEGGQSKLQQLKPLLLIFVYLFSAAFLLNYGNWNTAEAMLDFMGLFYIVFSFFKLLDLKGFPESFRMYDPLAKVLPAYGWVYPFIELALGLMFLMRFQITIALLATILILGITTVGVTKTLLDKKSIRCACLGTALKLPMTEATFIENAIMLVMAASMLFLRF